MRARIRRSFGLLLIALIGAVGAIGAFAPTAAAATGTTAWSQFHFSPGLGGYNNVETVLNTRNVNHLTLKWQTDIGGTEVRSIESTPVEAGGRIFIASMGGVTCFPGCIPEEAYLYSLSANTGQILWRRALGTDQVRSTAAVSGGAVYIGAGQTFYAFSAGTGSPIWSTQLGGYVGPAATLNLGLVYTGASDGRLYAISAATGAVKWSALTGGPISSPVAAAGNRVFTGSEDGSLYAFDALTGALVWKRLDGVKQGGAAVLDGKAYVVTSGSGGLVDTLHAMRAASGSQAWSSPSASDVHSTPVVGAGLVVVGAVNEPQMRAYDASTGRQLWARNVGPEVLGSPVLANGVVYVLTDVGMLHVIDARSGRELLAWTPPPSDNGFATVNTPIVVNGMVYAGFGDGFVRGFGLG